MESLSGFGIIILFFILLLALLLMAHIRLRAGLSSLCRQLEEIGRGSHMELALDSRQKPLPALCGILNHVLSFKDKNHIRYEQAQKLLKQNITGLAHDIRTPLTGARGYVQFAMECQHPEKQAHYLQAAEKRLSELQDMREEMFLYTKLTDEDYSLSLRKLQVLPLLSECLLSLYTRFEEAGISPNVTFQSEGFQVNADEDALKRVFLNLLQNALIHGAGDITILQAQDWISFENPLPKEDSVPDPCLMFDRFYKADTARGKGSSGLGLFIVKELMERMGGSVSARAKDGVLAVTLRFPSLLQGLSFTGSA